MAGDEFVQLTLQQIHDLILYPGCVVQTIYSEYTANTNLTAIIPGDDTIPQNTEGTRNLVRLRLLQDLPRARYWLSLAVNGQLTLVVSACAALFRDAVVPAVASQFDTSKLVERPEEFSI